MKLQATWQRKEGSTKQKPSVTSVKEYVFYIWIIYLKLYFAFKGRTLRSQLHRQGQEGEEEEEGGDWDQFRWKWLNIWNAQPTNYVNFEN